MPEPRKRLAVLIDADNLPGPIAARLFPIIAEVGHGSVRRMYGDFTQGQAKTWITMAAKHAIVPVQTFAAAANKNGADIALVIDAMDMLHSGRFDGFCLVSSDSDFTRLALRIREQGLDVFGFGADKTPDGFKNACTAFHNTSTLPKKIKTDAAARNPGA